MNIALPLVDQGEAVGAEALGNSRNKAPVKYIRAHSAVGGPELEPERIRTVCRGVGVFASRMVGDGWFKREGEGMPQDPIVVGTDGTPRAELAVDTAGELAQTLGAPVHVVCVPSAIVGKDWPPRITAQQIVADAADRLRARGIAVQTHLPVSDAAPGLIAVAEDEQAQMIVVGNKGMTGIRRVFGSIPNRVTHEARCDVLIVPTKSRSVPEFRGGSIVVGTDGSSRAARAVKEAIRLSKALDGDLHIVSSSKPPESPEPALADAAAKAADKGVNPITHPRHDDPADALLDVAKENDATIIVVGSKGMHADEREWLGNIPDKLSHTASCAVLIAYTAEASGDGGEAMSAVAAGETGSSGEDAST